MELKSEILTVIDLLKLKKNSMLIVNPEYQRGAVWNEPQQKKLIDSVMRGYPLPLIYLHHKVRTIAGMRSEGLEIIDGQQRINALDRFSEGAFKLFDPVKDDKQARFPNFIKNKPCPWAQQNFLSLSSELREKFLETSLNEVKITTDDEDEARDLFIRLQAGLPLNAQEKRDAWPGGFTQLVLQLAGKKEIMRYPGNDFFRYLVKNKSADRGEVRQLCAQICMLVFSRLETGSLTDIGTQDVDEFYYRNLDFSLDDLRVTRITKVLDLAVQIFASRLAPKFRAHEAIHVVLLLDTLVHSYSRSWEPNFHAAYDKFKELAAVDKKARSGDFWYEYGALTQTQSSEARTIQRRHAFFLKHMLTNLQPVMLDKSRIFGEVEREILYYQQGKKCAVCNLDLKWSELEVHHVEEHHVGGKTALENGAIVHKECHPKGGLTKKFAISWADQKKSIDADTSHAELAASPSE